MISIIIEPRSCCERHFRKDLEGAKGLLDLFGHSPGRQAVLRISLASQRELAKEGYHGEESKSEGRRPESDRS